MEIPGLLLAVHDPNFRGQMAIDCYRPALGRHGVRIEIEMGNLPKSMNAGIGAARSVDSNRTLHDAFQSPFNMILNGFAVRLRLPTVEWFAVVGD